MEEAFGHDMSLAYFDCTNFYFEIDREDDFRRKSPSKEHRPEPTVAIGLLLDANCIPVAMSLFPDSESDRPQLGRCIAQMKERGSISGRTVRVADKGLSCAANIAEAVLAGDGYIFSKSVKALPAKERTWALSGDGWTDVADGKGETSFRYKVADGDFEYTVEGEDGRKRKVSLPERRVVTYSPSLARKQKYEIDRQVEKARSLKAAAAKRSEYGDSAKYVTYSPVDGEGELREDAKVAAMLNHEAIRKARALAGYNMIVTSKTRMDPRAIYSTYHRLWRIEESFRVMKSELDARPVYLQRQSTITGHFLVCYIAVLLMRLLQVKVLGDSFSSKDIMGLCRGLDVCRTSERRYANISRRSPIIEELASRTGLPLLHFNLTEGDVKAISSCTLAHAARRREGPLCRQEARLRGLIAPYRGSKNQSPV